MKRRLNLTIHPQIYSKAELLTQLLDYDGVNALIEHLIRQEFEARHGPLRFNGDDPNQSEPPSSKRPKGPKGPKNK